MSDSQKASTPGSLTSELGSDRPIESKDQDRLGRAKFAHHLARAIKDWREDESLVVAICGEWGIGKSSLKNLVLEDLRNGGDRKPDVIQFNPWQWAGHENQSAAFFREVLAVLSGKRDERTQAVVRTLRRYAAYLGLISSILSGPKGFLAAAFGLFGLLSIVPPFFVSSELTRILGAVLGTAAIALALLFQWGEEVLKKIAAWKDLAGIANRSLEERKQDVVSALEKYENTLLVVVDDVDRLTAAEIQAVFQLIKANADFPRFVYLIMFQRQVVESALHQLTSQNGRQFLEKIVHVSFDVPPPRQDEVDKVLSEGLERVLGAASAAAIDQTYWGNVYFGALRTYFHDLRDVKRFLASFEFHTNLLRIDGTLDVNAVDLIAVETLRLFEPDFYRAIRNAKHRLTASGSPGASDRERVETEIQAVVAVAPPDKKKAASELIRNLFPTAAFALGGPYYSSNRPAEWNRELRICEREFFDRYFQLELDKGDVSQAQVERLLAVSSNYRDFREALEELESEGQLNAALDRLDSNRAKVASANILPALTVLFDIGERLPELNPGEFLGPAWTICRIAHALLKAEPESTRIEKLEASLRDTAGLRIPVMFVSLNTNRKDREARPDEIIIPDNAVAELRGICIAKIQRAAAEGDLLERHDLAYVLYRWREWGAEAEVREWVRNVTTKSPEGSLAFLRGFLHRGTSQTVGDHVARLGYFMKYSEIEDFADIEALAREIGSLGERNLNELDRRVLQEFRKALERKRSGKPEGTFGWED